MSEEQIFNSADVVSATPSQEEPKLNEQEEKTPVYQPANEGYSLAPDINDIGDGVINLERENMGALKKVQNHIYAAQPFYRQFMGETKEGLGLKSDDDYEEVEGYDITEDKETFKKIADMGFDKATLVNLIDQNPVSAEHALDLAKHESNLMKMTQTLTSSGMGKAGQFAAGFVSIESIGLAMLPMPAYAKAAQVAYKIGSRAYRANQLAYRLNLMRRAGIVFAGNAVAEGALYHALADNGENLSYKLEDSILTGMLAGGIVTGVDQFAIRKAARNGYNASATRAMKKKKQARIDEQSEFLAVASKQSEKELSEIRGLEARRKELHSLLAAPNLRKKKGMVDELKEITGKLHSMSPEGKALKAFKRANKGVFEEWDAIDSVATAGKAADKEIGVLTKTIKSAEKKASTINKKIEGLADNKMVKRYSDELESLNKEIESTGATPALSKKLDSVKRKLDNAINKVDEKRKGFEDELTTLRSSIDKDNLKLKPLREASAKATSPEYLTKRANAQVAKDGAERKLKELKDAYDEMVAYSKGDGVQYIETKEYARRVHSAEVIEATRHWMRAHGDELTPEKIKELKEILQDSENKILNGYIKESKDAIERVNDWARTYDKENAPTHVIEDVKKIEGKSDYDPTKWLMKILRTNTEDAANDIYGDSVKAERTYQGTKAFKLLDSMAKSVTGNVSDRVGIADAESFRMGYDNAVAKVIHKYQGKVAKELGVSKEEVRELLTDGIEGYKIDGKSPSFDKMVSEVKALNKLMEEEAYAATGENSLKSGGNHLPRVLNTSKVDRVKMNIREAIWREDPSLSPEEVNKKVFGSIKTVVYNSLKAASDDIPDDILDQVAHGYTGFMEARMAGKNGMDIPSYINKNVKEQYRDVTRNMFDIFEANKSDTIDLEEVINKAAGSLIGKRLMSKAEFDAKVAEHVKSGKTTYDAIQLVKKESKRGSAKEGESQKVSGLKSRFKMDMKKETMVGGKLISSSGNHTTIANGIPVSMSDFMIRDSATLFTRKTAFLGDITAKRRAGLPIDQTEFTQKLDEALAEMEMNGSKDASRRRYRSYIEQLDRQMKGLPNFETTGEIGVLNDMIGVSKALAFGSKLTKAWIPAFTESVRVFAMTGVEYLLKSPSMMKARHNFVRGTASEQEDMARNLMMLGSTNDSRFGNMFHNPDDIDDLSGFASNLKATRRKSNHYLGHLVGMAQVDSWTRNVANAVFRQNFIRHILDNKIKINMKPEEIGYTGASKERIDKLMRNHAKKDTDGNYYLDMGGEVSSEMEMALADFRTMVDIGQRASVQRAYAGEGLELAWGNATEIVSLLLQFQRFGLDSFNKQYRRDLHFAKYVNSSEKGYRGYKILSQQWGAILFAAAAAHVGKTYFGNIGHPNAKERIDKALDPTTVAFSSLRNHSAVGMPIGNFFDILGYLDTMFGSGEYAKRTQYMKTSDALNIPTADVINDMAKSMSGDTQALIRWLPTAPAKWAASAIIADK